MLWFFFFFQAEDGIRDVAVTGVQTCALPIYLLRDRDAIFGNDFREQVRDVGICEVLSRPGSPWQRAYIGRVIGSIRRECLDHVIEIGRAHAELQSRLHLVCRLLLEKKKNSMSCPNASSV